MIFICLTIVDLPLSPEPIAMMVSMVLMVPLSRKTVRSMGGWNHVPYLTEGFCILVEVFSNPPPTSYQSLDFSSSAPYPPYSSSCKHPSCFTSLAAEAAPALPGNNFDEWKCDSRWSCSVYTVRGRLVRLVSSVRIDVCDVIIGRPCPTFDTYPTRFARRSIRFQLLLSCLKMLYSICAQGLFESRIGQY